MISTSDSQSTLKMFVIYRKPKDYPDNYVVRLWEIEPLKVTPKELIGIKKTLEEARILIPKGCKNIGRLEQDDPYIEEVWI